MALLSVLDEALAFAVAAAWLLHAELIQTQEKLSLLR
jgi:hypothetical protein